MQHTIPPQLGGFGLCLALCCGSSQNGLEGTSKDHLNTPSLPPPPRSSSPVRQLTYPGRQERKKVEVQKAASKL